MLVISSEGGRFPLGLIIASTFWIACFGVFVFGYSKDSQTCIISPDNKEFPITGPILDEINPTAAGNSIDVALRFKKFFIIGLCLAAFQVLIGTISWLVKLSVNMARLLFNMYHFSQMVFLVNWIAIFYVRTQPSAIACCGKLMIINNQEDREALLYTQGVFIVVCGAIIVLIASITLMASFIAMMRGKSTL